MPQAAAHEQGLHAFGWLLLAAGPPKARACTTRQRPRDAEPPPAAAACRAPAWRARTPGAACPGQPRRLHPRLEGRLCAGPQPPPSPAPALIFFSPGPAHRLHHRVKQLPAAQQLHDQVDLPAEGRRTAHRISLEVWSNPAGRSKRWARLRPAAPPSRLGAPSHKAPLATQRCALLLHRGARRASRPGASCILILVLVLTTSEAAHLVVPHKVLLERHDVGVVQVQQRVDLLRRACAARRPATFRTGA